jgi:mannonate dehydratase
MKRSRREFIGTGAALAAISATGVRPAGAQALPDKGHRWDEACAWMKLSLAYFHSGGVRGRPERVSMARQMGVLGGVGGGGRDVAETKRAYEEMGLEWTVLEGVNLTRAQLGVAGRDEDIERFIASSATARRSASGSSATTGCPR